MVGPNFERQEKELALRVTDKTVQKGPTKICVKMPKKTLPRGFLCNGMQYSPYTPITKAQKQ